MSNVKNAPKVKAENTKKDSQKTAVNQLVEAVEVKKPEAKKPTAKKQKTSIHDTKYGKQVLATNKALKAYEVSLNGAIGRIIDANKNGEVKLTAAQKKVLTKSKSNKAVYKRIGEVVPAAKVSGNYSPWKVLQKLYKHEEELVKLTK